MKKYTKIENIYARDERTKKLIEGRYNNSTVEYLSNCEWIGTEKIDGTNIGVVWDGYRVSFQGRTEKAIIPPHLLAKLEAMFGGSANEELFETVFKDKEVILFGEGFGHKIQACGDDYLGEDVGFILFDVFVVSSNCWLARDAVEAVGARLNVPVVPIVFKGTLSEAVEYIKTQPDSTIGSAKMEGIVCTPMLHLLDRLGERVIVKVKCVDWREDK